MGLLLAAIWMFFNGFPTLAKINKSLDDFHSLSFYCKNGAFRLLLLTILKWLFASVLSMEFNFANSKIGVRIVLGGRSDGRLLALFCVSVGRLKNGVMFRMIIY